MPDYNFNPAIGRTANPTSNKRSVPHSVSAWTLPRCPTPRCRNLVSACSGGRCWTCSAQEYEKERR